LQKATTRVYFINEGLAVGSIHLQPDGVAHRKLGFGWPLSPFSSEICCAPGRKLRLLAHRHLHGDPLPLRQLPPLKAQLGAKSHRSEALYSPHSPALLSFWDIDWAWGDCCALRQTSRSDKYRRVILRKPETPRAKRGWEMDQQLGRTRHRDRAGGTGRAG
jgi:hypothetical protein